MSDIPHLFPGQEQTLKFDLEQTRAIASPVRSEVFWACSPTDPRSISDIAVAVAKSPQTVNYHVSELVAARLLIAVGERKKRSRIEKLYVWGAGRYYGGGPNESLEYRQEASRGFDAIMRTYSREIEAFNLSVDHSDKLLPYVMFTYESLRMSPDRAAEMYKRMRAVVKEYLEQPDDPNGVRIHVSIVGAPTLVEARSLLPKKPRKPRTKKT